MAGKSPYTEAHRNKLKAMFEAGETIEDIASEIGCCTSTATRMAREMGLIRDKPKPTRRLSPDEKQFILDNYESMTIHAMADALGLSWATVQARMRDMGLPCAIEDNGWSERDVMRLRDLAAEKKTVAEIADALDRTENAIRSKAKKTGILIYQPGRKWRLEEIDYLRRNWGRVAVSTIAKNLDRDVSGVVQKAHKMRLPPVYNNAENISMADFCRATGISRDRIMGTLAPKHDFPLLSKKYGKQQYYYYVDFDAILGWMESHQSMYDATMIEDGFFVPEPDWLKKKRYGDRLDKDGISQDAKRRWWTKNEVDHALLLRQMGYSIEQIAKKLGRGTWAVRSKLAATGGGYQLPQFWTGKDFRFIRDNWETMSDKEMAAALGRPVSSVESHRQDMGLKRRSKDRHKDVREYVVAHWKEESDRQIAERFGLPVKTVANVRTSQKLFRAARRGKRRKDLKKDGD